MRLLLEQTNSDFRLTLRPTSFKLPLDVSRCLKTSYVAVEHLCSPPISQKLLLLDENHHICKISITSLSNFHLAVTHTDETLFIFTQTQTVDVPVESLHSRKVQNFMGRFTLSVPGLLGNNVLQRHPVLHPSSHRRIFSASESFTEEALSCSFNLDNVSRLTEKAPSAHLKKPFSPVASLNPSTPSTNNKERSV